MSLYNVDQLLDVLVRGFARCHQIAYEPIRLCTTRAEEDCTLLVCALNIVVDKPLLQAFGVRDPVFTLRIKWSDCSVRCHFFKVPSLPIMC